MANLLFEPSFGGLRGNVCTLSIARWKARGRLPVWDNWTFFASSYVISRYCSTSVLFRAVGSLWAQILGGRGRRPQYCWYQKTRVFLLPPSEDRMILSLVRLDRAGTSMWRMDRQIDGRNCRSYYSAATYTDNCLCRTPPKAIGSARDLMRRHERFSTSKMLTVSTYTDTANATFSVLECTLNN